MAYVFSSTKLEIRAEQVLPGSKGRWGEEGGGQGVWEINGPNNVCTCEYMNKEKKFFNKVFLLNPI
jgi:hypothetical protein